MVNVDGRRPSGKRVQSSVVWFATKCRVTPGRMKKPPEYQGADGHKVVASSKMLEALMVEEFLVWLRDSCDNVKIRYVAAADCTNATEPAHRCHRCTCCCVA